MGGRIAVALHPVVGAGEHLAALPLKLIAGAGFVALGLWTIWDHLRAVQVV